MSDLHLNGSRCGAPWQIFRGDITNAMRTCQSCRDRRALGAHTAYYGAGVVLRCPSCEDVAIRIGTRPDRLIIEWRGVFDWSAARATGTECSFSRA